MPINITGFAPSVTFAENAVNATPQLIDSDVVFTTSGSLAGGRLVVRGLLAEDRVSILTEGNGTGQIGVSGSAISYEGVIIGTASGGVGSAFTVTFNSAVTGPAVDALIQRLAYANVSDTPSATRTLTLSVADSVGGNLATPQFTQLTGPANPFNGFEIAPAEKYAEFGLTFGRFSAPSFVDLDGDGRLDLVSGSGFGALQAWRNTVSGFTALNGAAGSINANPFADLNVGANSTPSFVDLDGDGLLDLVSGNIGGVFTVWRNTGSGFTLLADTANPFDGVRVNGLNGFGQSAPSFVDLDGDGDFDLVSGGDRGGLYAWRNNGSGQRFTALTGADNPFDGIDVGYASTPTFVDLDGDGLLDLVSGEALGKLLAWRNTTPLPSITVTVTAENDAPVITSAATALSAENRPAGDIIYQGTATDPDGSPSNFTWLLSGTDAALFNISSSGAVTFKTSPNFEAPADTGGNNVYDITVTASDGTLSSAAQAVAITVTDVQESATLTGFASSATFAKNTVNVTPQLMDSDVVFTAGSSMAGGRLVVGGLLAEDRVSILTEGSGAGQIGVSGSTISYGGVTIGTASGGAGSAFTVTFNNDVTGAAVDALIQRLAYGNVSNTPTATRTLTLDVVDATGRHLAATPMPQFAPLPLPGNLNPFNGIDVGRYSAPSFVDLDADGRLDLVSGAYDGTLLAWRNTVSGFTALTGTDNPFNGFDVGFISTPSFVDLNGDGRLDLVSGEFDGTLLAWRNTVSGFTALTSSANPFNTFDVGQFSTPSFVDLDGDGRLDLVSGASDGTLLAWRNTVSGFTALTGTDNPFNGFNVGRYSKPSFVDLDGDGRLDLVSGEYNGTLLAWRNTASGFTALTGTANPFNGIDVGKFSAPSLVDLDGDGRLDLVSGEEFGTLLAWPNTTPLPSITITVTTQNGAPVITSAATAGFAENATGTAYQATGSDPEAGTTLTWSLTGADAGLFNINAMTGAVTFKILPNFEAPADVGGNNVYDITVTASDSVLTSAPQAVVISVTDVTGPGQTGTPGPDALTVGAENARLSGLGGNDTLTGGAGRDTLDGGDGNDVFVISDTLDLIIETSGGGADTIITSVSMTMPDQVEALQIAAGISGITITGGAGNDMLIGNGLANTFVGGAGDDVILAGNVTLADIYALFAT
jgi:hypothetical protein